MTVACPRHGLIAAPKDTPCPHCQVALYDLDDRNARDVVRANRHTALKARRTIIGAVFVVACTIWAFASGSGNAGLGLNILPLFVGVALALFTAAPLARAIERSMPLRGLDTWLQQHRV